MLRKGEDRERVAAELSRIEKRSTDNTSLLAGRLEKLTGLATRITILGYLLRGGIPSSGDRLLATQLGTTGFNLVKAGCFGVMLARRNGNIETVGLDHVHNHHKLVPLDHSAVLSARSVGTVFGD